MDAAEFDISSPPCKTVLPAVMVTLNWITPTLIFSASNLEGVWDFLKYWEECRLEEHEFWSRNSQISLTSLLKMVQSRQNLQIMHWHILSPQKLFFFCKIKMNTASRDLDIHAAVCVQKLSRLQLPYGSYSERITLFVSWPALLHLLPLKQQKIPISKTFTVVIWSLGNDLKALWIPPACDKIKGWK